MIMYDETFLMDEELEEAAPALDEEAEVPEDTEEEAPAEIVEEEEEL